MVLKKNKKNGGIFVNKKPFTPNYACSTEKIIPEAVEQKIRKRIVLFARI